MNHYANTEFPASDEIAAIYVRQLAAFGEPGSWFDGAARLALAAEARNARVEAGIQETSNSAPGEPARNLPIVVT